MDYPLSGYEIINYINQCGDKIRVITYPEIKNRKFKTERDLFHDCDGVILLYKTGENFGHWCLIHKTSEGIEFFDSYGALVDSQLEQIEKKYELHDGQEYPHLVKLLKNFPYIISNAVQLQAKNPVVQTCGRWCIFRYLTRNIPLKQFINIFRKGNIHDLINEPLANDCFANDQLICELVKL